MGGGGAIVTGTEPIVRELWAERDGCIAKQTTLHAVRILDCDGAGTWSAVIGGLDWVIEERKRLGRVCGGLHELRWG